MNDSPFIERILTEAEVHERRVLLEQFLDEQDDLAGAIDEKRREIKEHNVSIERVTWRVRQLRTEIRTRIVNDPAPPPQQHLPHESFTVQSSDGTRVTVTPTRAAARDEPGPNMFEMRYPIARNHPDLFRDIKDAGHVLDPAMAVALNALHEDSGKFEAIAHWARVSKAYALERKGPRDLGPLPAWMPMPVAQPEAWIEIVNAGEPVAAKPKRKRGARPLT